MTWHKDVSDRCTPHRCACGAEYPGIPTKGAKCECGCARCENSEIDAEGNPRVECEACGKVTLDDNTDVCHNPDCPTNARMKLRVRDPWRADVAMKDLRRALDRANEIAQWDHHREDGVIWNDLGALSVNLDSARNALADLEVSLSVSPTPTTDE